MSNSVFLHGVALANYRGIGPEPELIGGFRRFNFFIGPNNAGKSTVLQFMSNHLHGVALPDNNYSPRGEELSSLDVRDGASRTEVITGIGYLESAIREVCAGSDRRDFALQTNVFELLDELLSKLSRAECLWITRSRNNRERMEPLLRFPPLQDFVTRENENAWAKLWAWRTGQSPDDTRLFWGDKVAHAADTLATIFNCIPTSLPPVSLVPAIRKISSGAQGSASCDGDGLIAELSRLKSPDKERRKDRGKFLRINQFLQDVTGCRDAQIDIPHDQSCVIVMMDSKELPLENLGTGIEEVIMLATYCTLKEKQIVCIEEPEIHLHPLLQRRLMQYLEEHTDNQYFIATHSASIIDMPGAAVYHVTNEGGFTKVRSVQSASARFEVCRDLGYKASDILQSNAIIWVEGPSDRIYLQHWIAAVAPELREGIDFSIMFYGGRLLSHLHADDDGAGEEDVDALIAVRQLNRSLAFVIDSDKAKADDPINGTKTRILDEVKQGGVGWLTAGREIENYVPPAIMAEAIKKVYSNFEKQLDNGPFDHVLPFTRTDGKRVESPDKVRVARAVCQHKADLSVLDLQARIHELVAMIRRANGLAEGPGA